MQRKAYISSFAFLALACSVGALSTGFEPIDKCIATIDMNDLKKELKDVATCGETPFDEFLNDPLVSSAQTTMKDVFSAIKDNEMGKGIEIAFDFLSQVENGEVGSMCGALNTKVTQCLADGLPVIINRVLSNPSCTDLSKLLDTLGLALFPKYDGKNSKKGLESFLDTLIYDLDALVCSKRSDGQFCGYNLVHQLFPSKGKETMTHLLETLKRMFPLDAAKQCKTLDGKAFVYDTNVWDYGACSVPFEQTISYLRNIPVLHLFFNVKLPLVGLSVRDFIHGWQEAPCCSFETTHVSPEDVFQSVVISPTCKDLPPTKGCSTVELPSLLKNLPVPGLETCMAADDGFSLLNVFKIFGSSPQCDVVGTVSELLKTNLVKKAVDALPQILDSFKSDPINGVEQMVKLFASLKNEDFGSLCYILNAKLYPCLSDTLEQLGRLFNSECCSEFNGFVNLIRMFVVPPHMDGSIRTLLETILMDVDSLVCSQRLDDEFCGFNLASNVFSSFNSITDKLPKMAKIPQDQMCLALSGETYRANDRPQNLWDFGQCSHSWESLMATLRDVPATRLLYHFEVPVLDFTLGDLLRGWEEAPCCTFKTTTDIPVDIFNLNRALPQCQRDPQDAEKCRATKAKFPLFFGMLPGIKQCFGSELNLANILEDFSSCDQCNILEIKDKVLDNEFIKEAISEVSEILADSDLDMNEKLMRALWWLATNENERFLSLCGALNDVLLPCISQLLPKLFAHLEEDCCGTFSMVLDVLTLLVVPEGTHEGFRGFLETAISSINNVVCSIRVNGDDGEEPNTTCIYNVLYNSYMISGSIWSIEKEHQCDVLGGSQQYPVTAWNLGECSSKIVSLLELVKGIPLLNIFFGIEAMDDLKIGDLLGAWSQAPCCDFKTKVESPPNPFTLEMPRSSCKSSNEPMCIKDRPRDSTVIPHVLYFQEVAGMSKCFGSGFNMTAVLARFSQSDVCNAFVVDDLWNQKNPAVKAIIDKVGNVITQMGSDDHAAGLLNGIDDILKSSRRMKNQDVGTFCEFLQGNLSGCLKDVIENFGSMLDNNDCCKDGYSVFLGEFYGTNIKPTNHDYPSGRVFLQGLVKNLNAVVCTKHSESDYCGYRLASNTLGFDYTKNSPDLDPLTGVAIYTLYPLFRMLTTPKDQECSMLKAEEFVFNEIGDTWKGMWFKYGCCGEPLGNLLRTIGSIPLLSPAAPDISFNIKDMGLGHFLANQVTAEQILRGYPNICKCRFGAEQCSYSGDAIDTVIPHCEKK